MDSRQIERKAQAAQQSMARRAQRLEKAQAAAVQAQLAARHMQRQSSQQKDQQQPQQPGRATLQQVSPCPASHCHPLIALSAQWLAQKIAVMACPASYAGLQQCSLAHLLIHKDTFADALHHVQNFRSSPHSMCTLVIYVCRTGDRR